MNGNNYIAIYLLVLGTIALAWAGCASTKEGDELQPEVITTEPRDTIDLTKITPDTLRDVDTALQVFKDNYQIALLLPFYLDSLNNGKVTEKEEARGYQYVYPPSKVGLDFYQGMLVALDSLRRSGLNATVKVYDTYKDTQQVNRLLATDTSLQNSDLIIGPVYGSMLKPVAAFAKRFQIPMVSPFSPSTDVTEGNPYYMMVSPRLEVHYRHLFKHLVQEYDDVNRVLLYKPEENEVAYKDLFLKMEEEYHTQLEKDSLQDTLFVLNELLYDRDTVAEAYKNEKKSEWYKYLEPYMDEERKNVIVLPSVDVSFIHVILLDLNSLTADYDIEVLASPVLAGYDNFEIPVLNNLKVTYTSGTYYDTTFHRSSFYNSYFKHYHAEPGRTAVIGHDITLFFGQKLYNYGLLYNLHLGDTATTVGSTAFNFQPALLPVADTLKDSLSVSTDPDFMPTKKERPVMDFMENKHLHLLRYQDYSIIKLN